MSKLEEYIQKKAEQFYTLKSREQNKADVVPALHTLWEEAENFCREQERQNHAHNRTQHTLDYCHIQVVTICEECFNKMLELHQKYYKELSNRGWNP